jgi:hypothetical protein
MGSDIAVQLPAAFRRSPGNVHRSDIADPLAIRSRAAAQECFDPAMSSRAPLRAGTPSVCNRLDEDWIFHDYLNSQITRLLLRATMQRKISSYL